MNLDSSHNDPKGSGGHRGQSKEPTPPATPRCRSHPPPPRDSVTCTGALRRTALPTAALQKSTRPERRGITGTVGRDSEGACGEGSRSPARREGRCRSGEREDCASVRPPPALRVRIALVLLCRGTGGGQADGTRPAPVVRPPCDIPLGCCVFTGPWTVTRSSLRMLRRVAAFCRPLRPVLLLVSFPRSRSPVVGLPRLCWLRRVPFARQRRPVVGVLGAVLVVAGGRLTVV